MNSHKRKWTFILFRWGHLQLVDLIYNNLDYIFKIWMEWAHSGSITYVNSRKNRWNCIVRTDSDRKLNLGGQRAYSVDYRSILIFLFWQECHSWATRFLLNERKSCTHKWWCFPRIVFHSSIIRNTCMFFPGVDS